MTTVAERFEAMVDRSGEHHLWQGAVDRNGTPQMRINGRLTTARRVAWELVHGLLSNGERVVACSDSRCVRIEHLTLRSRLAPQAPAPPPPRQRAPRGTGWIRETRPGVWKVTVAGRDDTGATVRRSRTVHGTRADADRAAAVLNAQLSGTVRTLDELMLMHLHQLETAGRSSHTLRRYRQLWHQWLAPSLAEHHPSTVRASDIEDALAAMHTHGQSPRSIHQAAVILNNALAAYTARAPATRPGPFKLPDGTYITETRRRK